MNKKKKWFQNKFLWGLVILILILLLLKLPEQMDKKVLMPMSNQQLETFLTEKKSGFVYVGRPTCPVCQEFEPKLVKEVKANKAEVHYFNTDEGRKENEEKMVEMLNSLNISTVPALLYIRDGQEVERIDEGRFSNEDIQQLMNKYMTAS
ncbi:thioredoxin family protein [Paenibacillus sp. 1001270B_150601_E10]|uniref:thioredoxin family protein n=1 Tax=Paenibacillus sp. 1001270B_150601_E10 TaxID=2787079 RepID=UPI00189DF167|nr:thioredoxin family protein [Paenibacillus sp. 1001270B_150601_E10]